MNSGNCTLWRSHPISPIENAPESSESSDPRSVKHALHDEPRTTTLSWQYRVLALISGMGVLTLLLVARSLEPETRGFGTHQQLGLPPCTSVVLFGMRCPSCGMTTSWSLTMRGRLLEAGAVNAGGLFLSIIALAYLPAACYFTYRGIVTRSGWFSLALATSILSALAIAVPQWLLRLST